MLCLPWHPPVWGVTSMVALSTLHLPAGQSCDGLERKPLRRG